MLKKLLLIVFLIPNAIAILLLSGKVNALATEFSHLKSIGGKTRKRREGKKREKQRERVMSIKAISVV